MMSFVALELFHGAVRAWPDLTGGTSGIAGVPRPETIDLLGLHLGFQSSSSIYWLTLVLAAITMALALLLTGGAFGLRLRAIAASERLAESAGVSVFRHRMFILALSAGLLGLCGPLEVSFSRLASPSNFELGVAIDWLVFAAVGDRFGAYGPAAVAAVLVTLTQIVFTELGVYRVILYGLILIVTVAAPRVSWPARPARAKLRPAEGDARPASAAESRTPRSIQERL
jgi:ABC-type branched-subunit amino acid transport system permease subunit